MHRLKLFGLGAMAVLAADMPALADPAIADEVGNDDAMVRSAHEAIADALNTALEHARSNRPVPWDDPADSLSGTITVFPAAMASGRPCRSFKYVVRNSEDEIVEKGLYCRDPIGLWRLAGVPDLIDKRPRPKPSQPDPEVARLQRNLIRLAYGAFDINGLLDADSGAALKQFEADESMQQADDPDAIRHALALSTATLERSDAGGTCEVPDGEDGTALMCGRRR